jgi:orotidine-5'-phosphate decarboxylase
MPVGDAAFARIASVRDTSEAAAGGPPTRERLIVALDVPDMPAAMGLVETLDDSVEFYKIGLELAMSGHYFELLRWLLAQGKRVFADLKLYDIPATVSAAVRQLADCGATLLTVHGERSVVEAAAKSAGTELKVIAVTVLTSMTQDDLAASGIEMDIASLVRHRALTACKAGAAGVVASGHEARELRAMLGPDALIVTPGIRPAFAAGRDDQARVVTPAGAIGSGASHLVVGRPIRSAADPYAAAQAIQAEIAAALR